MVTSIPRPGGAGVLVIGRGGPPANQISRDWAGGDGRQLGEGPHPPQDRVQSIPGSGPLPAYQE